MDLTKKGHVRLSDNEKILKVEGVGSGFVTCVSNLKNSTPIKFENVLFVPDLGSNLVSVKKFTLGKRYKIIFYDSKYEIFDNGKLITTTDASSGLYELKTIHMACIAAEKKHTINCQHTWHRRFGHRDPAAIKLLFEKDLARGLELSDCGIREKCECCIKGKLARKPFPKESLTKTSNVLDLIHTDVCGPMQTETHSKKRYILTLIDDFSRYTRVYFMRQKSEVTDLIIQFVEEMKTQRKQKPKMIR